MTPSIARRGALAGALALWACGGAPAAQQVADSPADGFFASLAGLCGQAFEGEAEMATAPDFGDDLVVHVRRCSADELQIPVHVGEDRSRTWLLTRTETGLRLKHDHRHEDGSEDAVTGYGGDSREPGTPTSQSFPADAFTAALIPEAAGNVWTLTIEPGSRLVYHLSRDGAPRATFTFDLTRPVDPPPDPWGYEGR